MSGRQAYSLDEIKSMLLERRHAVAQHYAPVAQGSYTDASQYWTLNPGRADRNVGSFVVYLEGAKAGRWADYATGEHGDLIDLIRLWQGGSLRDAIREARAFLGLQNDSPEDVARRKEAAERAKRLAAEAKAKDVEQKQRKSKSALALWLSGSLIAGTPAEFYLRDTRLIDLRQLGYQPKSLRFHPALTYKHFDRETGEVWEGRYPALLAIVNDGQGKAVACHRTWLAMNDRGLWDKAPVPVPKKVLGDYAGGSIHLWRGLYPSGGRNKPLADAPPGSKVLITEGVEDGLSAAVLMPSARIVVAISLSNLGNVILPRNIAEVTLIADRDENPEARAALDRAIRAHAKAGRVVRLWQNQSGGKDLNDALRAAVMARREAEATPKTGGTDAGSVMA